MKIERLLAIVIKMLNQNIVSANELAEHFEVSTRTIQRDMDAINAAGIPVVAYRGQNGGYGILENYKINKQFFSDTEKSLLLTTLEGIYKAYDDRRLNEIIDKLSLIKDRKCEVGGQDIILDFSPWANSEKNRDNVNTIRSAIEGSKVINFDYIDKNGKRTSREVEPLSLILKVSAWYLYAFCRERQDYRFFKLTRLRNLSILNKTFERGKEIVTRTPVADPRRSVKLKLKFNEHALNIIDEYFEYEDLELGEDGGYYASVEYPEDEWLYGMILRFGEDVEVVEPIFMREIMKDKLKNILKKYE